MVYRTVYGIKILYFSCLEHIKIRTIFKANSEAILKSMFCKHSSHFTPQETVEQRAPWGGGGGLHVLSPEGFKFGNQVQEMTLYIFSGSFFR